MTELASTGGELPCIFPAGFVGTFRSRDFDEVAAVACGWNQRYTKLGPGPFAGEVVQANAARVQVGTASWSCAVLATGAVPSGARTFALASSPRGRARISGCAIRPGELATRSDRDEFDFRTPDACELVVLSVEHGLLDRTAHMLFGSSWREVGGDSPIVRLRDAEGAEATLRRLLAAVRSDPTRLAEPSLAAAFEQEAAVALLAGVDLPPPPRVAAAERRRLAFRIEAFLRANRCRPVTIAELCAATGMAERSLHQACREHLGLPPIAYLRILRLHGARRELRDPDPTTTVTDTATRWGFFHFGEFAAAYRRHFGELPSQTLRPGNRR